MSVPSTSAVAKKPFYKKWWFIAVVLIVFVGALAQACGGGTKNATSTQSVAPVAGTQSAEGTQSTEET